MDQTFHIPFALGGLDLSSIPHLTTVLISPSQFRTLRSNLNFLTFPHFTQAFLAFTANLKQLPVPIQPLVTHAIPLSQFPVPTLALHLPKLPTDTVEQLNHSTASPSEIRSL